jgi:putative Mg2+ transporter-C (MgtC) family protein
MSTSWWHDVIPLTVSLVLGTVLGWERQVDRKPAGLRTHTLVCLGSTLFILAGRYAAATLGGTADPTRTLHGIVTGIGFLGAGAILHRDGGGVIGLTTAASIWIAAGVGAAAGLEAYPLAVGATVLTWIVLRLYLQIDRWLSPRDSGR